MSDKLSLIASLPSGELQGWFDALGKYQAEKPGERAALMDRARKIGYEIKGVSRG